MISTCLTSRPDLVVDRDHDGEPASPLAPRSADSRRAAAPAAPTLGSAPAVGLSHRMPAPCRGQRARGSPRRKSVVNLTGQSPKGMNVVFQLPWGSNYRREGPDVVRVAPTSFGLSNPEHRLPAAAGPAVLGDSPTAGTFSEPGPWIPPPHLPPGGTLTERLRRVVPPPRETRSTPPPAPARFFEPQETAGARGTCPLRQEGDR